MLIAAIDELSTGDVIGDFLCLCFISAHLIHQPKIGISFDTVMQGGMYPSKFIIALKSAKYCVTCHHHKVLTDERCWQ